MDVVVPLPVLTVIHEMNVILVFPSSIDMKSSILKVILLHVNPGTILPGGNPITLYDNIQFKSWILRYREERILLYKLDLELWKMALTMIPELDLHICSYLEDSDLGSVMMVSHAFYDLLRDSYFWQRRLTERFPRCPISNDPQQQYYHLASLSQGCLIYTSSQGDFYLLPNLSSLSHISPGCLVYASSQGDFYLLPNLSYAPIYGRVHYVRRNQYIHREIDLALTSGHLQYVDFQYPSKVFISVEHYKHQIGNEIHSVRVRHQVNWFTSVDDERRWITTLLEKARYYHQESNPMFQDSYTVITLEKHDWYFYDPVVDDFVLFS